VLLTRGLKDFITKYIFVGVLAASIFLFAVDDLADEGLFLFGYDQQFISTFPFINNLYFALMQTKLVVRPNLAYFHVLDFFVWFSILVWSIRLFAGVVYLKEYDDFYQVILSRLGKRYSGWHSYTATFCLCIALVGVWAITQPDILVDPILSFVIRHFTRLYFVLLANLYFLVGAGVTEAALFVMWKIFRQNRQGVVLWSAETQRE
jgi:hypothetical protein